LCRYNSGDYDSRTALHLAAVEGQLLTVDYLVNTCHAVGLCTLNALNP
jgi:hypothetical protein